MSRMETTGVGSGVKASLSIQPGGSKKSCFHLHWPVPEKIEVHIFSKEVSLRMWCVKLLSPHEKMACKIIPCGREQDD